jgi:drug/metabolite transporter (DMT)-like permease
MLEPTISQSKANAANRPNLSGYVAVLVATALWATSGIFIKFIVASSGVTALALSFYRNLFAFALLLVTIAVLRPGLLQVQRRDLPWLATLGGIMGVLTIVWALGVLLNGVAITTVQLAATPAIVAVVAWLIWREPLTRNKILAIVLTFAGTVLVTGLGAVSEAQLTLPGLLVGFSTPCAYAAWNLVGKKVGKDCSALTTLTYTFGFAALVLFPFQFFTPRPWPVPPIAWLWFAGLVGLGTAIPFPVYFFALGRLPASVASILAMTEIPIVSIYAYFLLGERMSPDQVVGAVLVVAGVSLLSGRKRRYR